MMNSLRIAAADKGGFVVIDDMVMRSDTGRSLVYAGSLSDCLEFLRSYFADAHKAASN